MTGHEPILAMRRAGQRPRYVWLHWGPCVLPGDFTVHLKPEDTPEREDFRFLLGITALVTGSTGEQARRLMDCCKRHAARVVCTCGDGYQVTQIIDTEGVLSWPK